MDKGGRERKTVQGKDRRGRGTDMLKIDQNIDYLSVLITSQSPLPTRNISLARCFAKKNQQNSESSDHVGFRISGPDCSTEASMKMRAEAKLFMLLRPVLKRAG